MQISLFSHSFSLFNLSPLGHSTVYRSKNYQLLPRVVDVDVRCSYCVCRETASKWSPLVYKDPKCFKFRNNTDCSSLEVLQKSRWVFTTILCMYVNGCLVVKSKHILTYWLTFFHLWLFKMELPECCKINIICFDLYFWIYRCKCIWYAVKGRLNGLNYSQFTFCFMNTVSVWKTM